MRLAIVDDDDNVLIEDEGKITIDNFKMKLISLIGLSKRKEQKMIGIIDAAWEWTEKALKNKTVYLDNLDRYGYNQLQDMIDEEHEEPSTFEWIDLPNEREVSNVQRTASHSKFEEAKKGN